MVKHDDHPTWRANRRNGNFLKSMEGEENEQRLKPGLLAVLKETQQTIHTFSGSFVHVHDPRDQQCSSVPRRS
jgi:hypothetical protein